MVIASILTINSFAMAESATSILNKGTVAGKIRDASMNAALINIVADATDTKAAELIATRDQLLQIIKTMENIKNDNENDKFLRMSNGIQMTLAMVSSVALGAHLSMAEHRKLTLTISAASAFMTSVTRWYKNRSSLGTTDVSQVFSQFTSELRQNGQAFTPEMKELMNHVSDMNNTVLKSKGALDSLVESSGTASYAATGLIIVMAITHWLSPKLGQQADIALKSLSVKTGAAVKNLGEFSGRSTKTTGVASGGSVLPDLIGNVMGLSTENSQKLIAMTVNDLTKATLNFQTQIDMITNAAK